MSIHFDGYDVVLEVKTSGYVIILEFDNIRGTTFHCSLNISSKQTRIVHTAIMVKMIDPACWIYFEFLYTYFVGMTITHAPHRNMNCGQ